jgi:serine/threonine protein kinase
VRIAGFGESASPEYPPAPADPTPDKSAPSPSRDCGYMAPEHHDNESSWRSDVFSFGIILYELVVGRRVFPEEFGTWRILKLLVLDNFRPEIPAFVAPAVNDLITECWAQDPSDRPTFDNIFERLEEMQFKVRPDVDSSKLSAFVKRMVKLEANHAGGEGESDASRFSAVFWAERTDLKRSLPESVNGKIYSAVSDRARRGTEPRERSSDGITAVEEGALWA